MPCWFLLDVDKYIGREAYGQGPEKMEFNIPFAGIGEPDVRKRHINNVRHLSLVPSGHKAGSCQEHIKHFNFIVIP